MVKIRLSNHTDVLSKQGDKFYIVSPANRVYATLSVDGTVAYSCITDEDPANALSPNDNRLNNAMSVAEFDVT